MSSGNLATRLQSHISSLTHTHKTSKIRQESASIFETFATFRVIQEHHPPPPPLPFSLVNRSDKNLTWQVILVLSAIFVVPFTKLLTLLSTDPCRIFWISNVWDHRLGKTQQTEDFKENKYIATYWKQHNNTRIRIYKIYLKKRRWNLSKYLLITKGHVNH